MYTQSTDYDKRIDRESRTFTDQFLILVGVVYGKEVK